MAGADRGALALGGDSAGLGAGRGGAGVLKGRAGTRWSCVVPQVSGLPAPGAVKVLRAASASHVSVRLGCAQTACRSPELASATLPTASSSESVC